MTRRAPRSSRRLAAATGIVAVALASGCWVVGTSLRAGGLLPEERVKAVVPGMAAQDVVDLLGPPTAVARPGATLQIPLFPGRKAGSREVAADSLYARFPSRPPIGPRDVIYLYEAWDFTRPGSYLAIYNSSYIGATTGTDQVRVERLLLLIDGEQRVVRDRLHEIETVSGPPVARPHAPSWGEP